MGMRREVTDSEPSRPEALWRNLVEAHRAFIEARMALLANSDLVVDLVRAALDRPSERSLAIDVARCLSEDDRKKLLPDLLQLSCYAHGLYAHSLADEATELLMSLPREWLIENIESHAEHILRDATYEEYRMLIRIYDRLSPAIAERLAERALQSEDDDIKEAGDDYLAGAGTAASSSAASTTRDTA